MMLGDLVVSLSLAADIGSLTIREPVQLPGPCAVLRYSRGRVIRKSEEGFTHQLSQHGHAEILDFELAKIRLPAPPTICTDNNADAQFALMSDR
jgi:hypothetical protein